MKKTLFILYSFLVIAVAEAQVAINSNSNAPHASAMLDISSSSKGLLIPRVHISSVDPSLSVPNAAHALVVYNTNTFFSKGPGFYFNAGTPNAIDWKLISDLIYPYYKGISENGSMFRLENYSQNTASSAIRALSGSGTAVFAETINGYALQTKGKINFSGATQTPAQGKVLTSDANGNATWEGAIAFLASGIQTGGASEIEPYHGKKVPYLSEIYDLGNNFNPSNISPHSTFTAPVHGIYHFDAGICFDFQVDGVRTWITLVRVRNGQKLELNTHEIEKTEGWVDNRLSIDCELLPGDQIYIHAGLSGFSNQYLDEQHSKNFFSGRLIIKLN